MKRYFPPPFKYELFRYDGFTGTNGRTFLTSSTDTVFTDTGLDTENNIYNYQVRFYDRDDNLIDSSAIASSLRLEARGELQSVRLTWEAEVPWSNQVQAHLTIISIEIVLTLTAMIQIFLCS